MSTRVCNSCGIEKPFSDYGKRKDCKDGIKPKCKGCYNKNRPSRAGSQKAKESWTRWYSENRETLLAIQKSDPARKDYSSTRYKEKGCEIRQQQSEYRKTQAHKALNRRKEAKRRASKLKATPPWLSEEHKKQIDGVYWLAQDLRSVTGEAYHVDHITPLKGKNVCGLHVPWNLQVLPADINLSKSNKF